MYIKSRILKSFYLTPEEAEKIKNEMLKRTITFYKASALTGMSIAMISFIINGRRAVNDDFKIFCNNWLGIKL